MDKRSIATALALLLAAPAWPSQERAKESEPTEPAAAGSADAAEPAAAAPPSEAGAGTAPAATSASGDPETEAVPVAEDGGVESKKPLCGNSDTRSKEGFTLSLNGGRSYQAGPFGTAMYGGGSFTIGKEGGAVGCEPQATATAGDSAISAARGDSESAKPTTPDG